MSSGEWAQLYANTYERAYLVPYVANEVLLDLGRDCLKHIQPRDRFPTTYEEHALYVLLPELLQRLHAATQICAGSGAGRFELLTGPLGQHRYSWDEAQPEAGQVAVRELASEDPLVRVYLAMEPGPLHDVLDLPGIPAPGSRHTINSRPCVVVQRKTLKNPDGSTYTVLVEYEQL